MNDEVETERAELERLARKYDLDNHHNAAMCPYCTPDRGALEMARVSIAVQRAYQRGFEDGRAAERVE